MSTLGAKLNRSLLRYYMFLFCIPNTFLPLSDVSGTSIRILLEPGPVLRFSASYHPASRDQGGYSSEIAMCSHLALVWAFGIGMNRTGLTN